MTYLRDAIAAVYAQVAAPDWAAPNLDGLTDVLRDLSWLPVGPVDLAFPEAGLARADADRLRSVLRRAERETAQSPRPVRVRAGA
jgi:hypothetical protein